MGRGAFSNLQITPPITPTDTATLGPQRLQRSLQETETNSAGAALNALSPVHKEATPSEGHRQPLG